VLEHAGAPGLSAGRRPGFAKVAASMAEGRAYDPRFPVGDELWK